VAVQLIGADGTLVALSDAGVGPFTRGVGTAGSGLVPVLNSWFEGAGDGARWRGSRKSSRLYLLPIIVHGATSGEVEANQRMIARALRAGEVTIRATSPDGVV